uniref:Uncharacterized protein n=1 Tax=Brassica oleracea var. oleracea TaxID=109376 RepID=A0A0D2ZXK6_BRAOL
MTFYKVELLKLNSRSTATIIVSRTTLPTESIRNGQHLSNPSHFLKVLKQSYLLNVKNPSEKMSNVLLQYCNRGLQ